MTHTPTKAALRRQVRQRRAALRDDQLTTRAERLTAALQDHIHPDAVVAGYLPMRGEPDLLAFLNRHSSEAGVVYLPVVPSAGRELKWAAWTPETPLRQHSTMPLREPDPELTVVDDLQQMFRRASGLGSDALNREAAPYQQAHHRPANLVLLVPALALDTSGARLGQGGGYYDTTLEQLPLLVEQHPQVRCEVIAVVHSEEVMEQGAFPVQPHDLRAPRAATECGIVDF